MSTKPLPPHLVGMTQERWSAMSKSERDAARDNSELNAALLPYVGKRVRVTPDREFGMSTFTVGMTTGWRPVLLAMQRGAGSSDTISVDERFDSIVEVPR